jgi:hypothetical protein
MRLNNAPGIRLGVLFSALVATVVASVYPTDNNTADVEVTVSRDANTASTFSINAPREVQVAPRDDEVRDPFASRKWVTPPAPPPVASPAPARIDIPVPQPALPPPIPVMPYRYASRLAYGADVVLYLSRADQIFAVGEGDVVEGQYKVTSTEDRRVQLQHLASGELQTLMLPVCRKNSRCALRRIDHVY